MTANSDIDALDFAVSHCQSYSDALWVADLVQSGYLRVLASACSRVLASACLRVLDRHRPFRNSEVIHRRLTDNLHECM